MSKEYVTLSREKLEELLKEAATDVYKMGLNDGVTVSREKLEELLRETATGMYKMGLNDGINQAFEQMGEKIRGKAQQFSNPAVRFVLMGLSDALIESSLAGR